MTIFSGPTGPKILLTQNQVMMPYPVHFPIVGADAHCQEQDCKQLCKRMVYTFYVQL